METEIIDCPKCGRHYADPIGEQGDIIESLATTGYCCDYCCEDAGDDDADVAKYAGYDE